MSQGSWFQISKSVKIPDSSLVKQLRFPFFFFYEQNSLVTLKVSASLYILNKSLITFDFLILCIHQVHFIPQEHKCVLDSCRALENEGWEVTYLPVQKSGRISVEELEKSIRPDTALVSVMMVNNEIGVIQPIQWVSVYLFLLFITAEQVSLFSSISIYIFAYCCHTQDLGNYEPPLFLDF